MALTEEQLQVYSSATNLLLRIIFSLVFLLAFIVVLGCLLYFCFKSKGAEITAPLGAVDAVLAGTLYPAVKYIFPLNR